MKIAVSIPVLLILIVTASPQFASAQNQPENRIIEVIGTARIYGDDIATARDQAISDCLVTAVSLVTTDLVHQSVLVQSFQDINRILFSGSDKFVQDYKVLTEATSGKIYRVMVDATVSVDKIREILSQNDILIQNETPLKVLLLIAEKNIGDADFKCWWANPDAEAISETGLTEALGKQGFVVVDHGRQLPSGISDSSTGVEPPPGPEMSDIQAAHLGVLFQADVVIVGTATAEIAPNVLSNELKSFEGTLNVRAIRTDTGNILAKTSQNILTADADDLAGGRSALTKAGDKTGELLGEQIQTAWQQTAKKGPINVTILVEGNYRLAHLVAFRRMLSDMPGLSNLQTRAMTPDETTLALDYEGTTQELAEALLLKSFKNFGIHITEATPDTIRLSLVSN